MSRPVTYAVVRTLFVRRHHRRDGVATTLVDRFLKWSRRRGCVEAHVDSYAANEPAQGFYERHRFQVQTVSRVHSL